MENVSFLLDNSCGEDAAKTLSWITSTMESIKMSRNQAASLIAAVGGDILGMYCPEDETALEIAQRICAINVPDEGSPHPKRATVSTYKDGVAFTTPGGVKVTVSSSDKGETLVEINFNRDSKFLSSSVIAMYAMATRAEFVAEIS